MSPATNWGGGHLWTTIATHCQPRAEHLRYDGGEFQFKCYFLGDSTQEVVPTEKLNPPFTSPEVPESNQVAIWKIHIFQSQLQSLMTMQKAQLITHPYLERGLFIWFQSRRVPFCCCQECFFTVGLKVFSVVVF